MIRFTSNYLRPVSFLLAMSILFQGCKIYYKQSVTTEQGIKSGKKIKIVFRDGTKSFYDGIYLKNDSLICAFTNKNRSELIETRIPVEQIKETILNISRYGKTTKFITYDDKRYIFDSFYYKNDTLFGLNKEKERSEIFIPISSIQEIHLKNKGASGAATTAVILGGGWALACIIAFIAYLVVLSNNSGY